MRYARALLGITLLVGGCSSNSGTTSPDFTIPPCTSNNDCAHSSAGHVCSGGTCVVCGSSADCPNGQKCDSMTACVACLVSSDCMPGQLCANKQCTVGCNAQAPCPM